MGNTNQASLRNLKNIHLVFHVSLLEPFYLQDGQLAPLGTISTINGEDD